jgi:putative DNA primase/helicase
MWLIDEHAPATFPPSAKAAPGERTDGRDNTRSGRAFHLALRLRRENATKEQFVEALQTDAELSEWAHDRRQVQRAWDAACRTIEGSADVDAEQDIKRLAALDRIAYDREREDAAARLHIRVSTLDDLVRQARSKGDKPGKGKILDLQSPEPWPDEVQGHELLTGLAAFFKRHAVVSDHAADAVALWAVHTHGFGIFRITPRLQFTAAVKGSGKTTMLELVSFVVPRPIEIETISPAFLFRAIELVKPTVLIDEADTVLHANNHELRGLINAGHKRGAQAGRVVGDDLEPRLFDCHCPVALAGIGRLPGTIEDRSITVQMKRRRPDESLAPIDDTARETADKLCRKAAAWAGRNAEALARHRPDMAGLINRAADRWAPLFAIADLAGGDWPTRAREAQTALDDQAREDDSAGNLGERLLPDIRDLFGAYVAENPGTVDHEMESAEIVRQLIAMEERPWAELPGKRGGALTTTRLARLLAPFGVRPEMIGPEARRRKGYKLLAFSDAFERHLSPQRPG